MIPHGVEIFVGLEPIDLRWSFDRLAGVVAERVARDARSGALFVFFGKRRDAIKVLFHDRTGMCLFYKRLDRRTFRLPEPREANATTVEIDEGALDDLLDGIDLDKPIRRIPPPPGSPVH
jgi:transposase